MLKKIFLLWLFFDFSNAQAQNIVLSFAENPPVRWENQVLKNAWSGGLNAPQFSHIKLNDDAILDLVVFDRTNNLLQTFIAQNGEWLAAPEYKKCFPDVQNWLLLRDFDMDGKIDLFTNTYMGVQVWKNIGTNEPKFVHFKTTLPTTGRSGDPLNMLIDQTDIPTIADIDGDGDLDFLNFVPSTGFSIEYHKNLSIEKYGKKDSLTFQKMTFEWGGLLECACGVYFFGTSSCRSERVMHAGSTITAFDADGDGDQDILVGEVSCNKIFYFENKGNANDAVFTEANLNYPLNKAVNFSTFPAAFLVDADLDGKNDLIAAPNVYYNEENAINFTASAWFYQNKGTNQNFDFEFQADNFLQNTMIDVGENAKPTPIDVDADGDLDLLISHRGTKGSNNVFASSLILLENIGSSAAPNFVLKDKDFLGLRSLNLQQISPVLADLDGDKALDMVFTAYNAQTSEAKTFYLPNQASQNQAPIWQISSTQNLSLTVSPFDQLLFYDLNADNLLDVFVCKFQGGLDFYTNTGNLTFTLAKQNFAGITNNTQKRFLSGVLADFNGDLKIDLLLGNQAGDLQLYSNIAKGLSENIAPQTVLFSADKTLEPARFLGRGLQPAIFQHQLLVGGTGGGLFWLKMDNVVLGEDENESIFFKMYPNPSQNQVFIETQEALNLAIFAVDGKKIGESHALFVGKNDIGLNLSAGLYLFKFTKKSGEFFVRKIMVE